MCFILKNKSNNPLQEFNTKYTGQIRYVFPCGWCSRFFTFTTKKEAMEFKLYMFKEARKQRIRWGDWGDVAVKFIDNVKIKEL